jgi:membrane-associated protein
MLSGLANYVSGAWWSYLVVLGLAYLDVLIPLVPSETAVITAGVLAGAGDMHLGLIIACGAVGAILGDNTAYLLGRYFEEPVRRRFFSGRKAEERIRWAEKQIDERGGELIIVARFIPAGRTVVTLSCGWLNMRWRRFIVFDVVAGVVWASYASLLGYFGGKTFEHSPWKGLVIALALGFSVTGGVELVRWLLRRRKARAAEATEAD